MKQQPDWKIILRIHGVYLGESPWIVCQAFISEMVLMLSYLGQGLLELGFRVVDLDTHRKSNEMY